MLLIPAGAIWVLGEPVLHKEINKMIKFLKESTEIYMSLNLVNNLDP